MLRLFGLRAHKPHPLYPWTPLANRAKGRGISVFIGEYTCTLGVVDDIKNPVCKDIQTFPNNPAIISSHLANMEQVNWAALTVDTADTDVQVLKLKTPASKSPLTVLAQERPQVLLEEPDTDKSYQIISALAHQQGVVCSHPTNKLAQLELLFTEANIPVLRTQLFPIALLNTAMAYNGWAKYAKDPLVFIMGTQGHVFLLDFTEQILGGPKRMPISHFRTDPNSETFLDELMSYLDGAFLQIARDGFGSVQACQFVSQLGDPTHLALNEMLQQRGDIIYVPHKTCERPELEVILYG